MSTKPRRAQHPEKPASGLIDATRAAGRLRAAEWALTAVSRRADLIGEIAALQGDLARRRAELAADDGLLARKLYELEALEKGEATKAAAFGPSSSLTLTLQQAAALLGVSEATAKSIGKRHGIGWCRDGRWRFSRNEVMHYVSGLPVESCL